MLNIKKSKIKLRLWKFLIILCLPNTIKPATAAKESTPLDRIIAQRRIEEERIEQARLARMASLVNIESTMEEEYARLKAKVIRDRQAQERSFQSSLSEKATEHQRFMNEIAQDKSRRAEEAMRIARAAEEEAMRIARAAEEEAMRIACAAEEEAMRNILYNETCAICLEDDCIQNLNETPCGHIFHPACLNQWRRTGGPAGNNCPMCRTPFSAH